MTRKPLTAFAAAKGDTAGLRHWTFVSRLDGSTRTEICPSWCTLTHEGDMATPTHPEDIHHSNESSSIVLTVTSGVDRTDEYDVLHTSLTVDPYSTNPAERVPHANVDLIDAYSIEGLDPDGLMRVITQLTAQLDQLRATHAHLIRARAEWNGVQA